MTLWPFKNDKQQKVISALCFIAGAILLFGFYNLLIGTSLCIFGLIYFLDTI